MAVFTIVAAEVKPLANTQMEDGVAGSVISPGQAVYRGSDGLTWPARADNAVELARGRGIAVNSAELAGQPVKIAVAGDVQIDTASVAEAAVGNLVVLGASAGGLYPETDLASSQFVTVLGVVKQNSSGCIVTLFPVATGIEKP
jgi:hypothetical protein